MNIFKILREQSAIGFDGKVIFQDSSTSRLLGEILMSSGKIVGCLYSGAIAKKALLNILYDDFSDNCSFNHVVEPEVISQGKHQLELKVSDLETEISALYEKIESTKKLRPPGNKRVMVNSDFVCRGAEISSKEFDILCTISDYGKISEIYLNSGLLAFEVTLALVSLRKKGALKVLS